MTYFQGVLLLSRLPLKSTWADIPVSGRQHLLGCKYHHLHVFRRQHVCAGSSCGVSVHHLRRQRGLILIHVGEFSVTQFRWLVNFGS